VPLVIPAPDAALEDPAQIDGATATVFTKCSTADQYESYVREHQELFQRRVDFEARLVPRHERFRVKGDCAACKRETAFFVDFLYSSSDRDSERVPNWREHLVCHRCKLPNRLRAVIDFMEQVPAPDRLDSLYVTEQTTPFFRFVKQRYPNTTGSELLRDGTALGKTNVLGVRNEDLTALTLRDSSVKVICTTDVLEHVPDYTKAIAECFRVLQPGGALIISVPFILNSRETLVRARVNADGSTHHLLAPEYHGDAQNPHGVLCYYHFGWDLLDSLRETGFSDSALYFYWSAARGYLGGAPFLICATKP